MILSKADAQAITAKILGLSKADRLKLRDAGQGEFYAFGPAIGQPGVIHFRSDEVRTTHPRPGRRHLLTAPAPIYVAYLEVTVAVEYCGSVTA